MESITNPNLALDASDDTARWRVCLTAPLFTDWSTQYIRLIVPGIMPGTPLALTMNNQPAPMQYTGHATAEGAEVMVFLGFTCGEEKVLVFTDTEEHTTDLSHVMLPLAGGTRVGVAEHALLIPAPNLIDGTVIGPFAGFAGFPFTSQIVCEQPFDSATLTRVNDGPLFIDYQLHYRFAESRHYTLDFRCYRQNPYIEVSEQCALGMHAYLTWTLNPGGLIFDQIISRDSFEGESQPTIEPLLMDRTRDVLCRLQMPVLSEYFIPNNRGWFALSDSRSEARGMLGVLGLYGAKWKEPVENMPEILGKDGSVEWKASLASGQRYWLLYHGPVERCYTRERRFIFHRLHAEFNALRLDEHLDVTGDMVYDATCWQEPGLFVGADYHQQARQRLEALPCLQRFHDHPDIWLQTNGLLHQAIFSYLLEPTPEAAHAIYDALIQRFQRWVRQFQGWRTDENDYMKNVIGFSRYLRGMLIGYELLRKDSVLTEEQVCTLNAYFAFAARRILDEGRWPHDRSWRHPDHPESTRDFYAYGGEHKPDRLVWSNSLPNFQSDPLCALAHLSAIFQNHPDALYWRDKALNDIDRQLTAYCGKSGAWQESINYALYTFSYFLITFRAVKQRWGIDFFNDTRMRRFAGWLCRFFGPYDKRFEAYTWPGIGNAIHPAMGGAYLLTYAAELPEGDALRDDCLAIYQLQASMLEVSEHYGTTLAAMAPLTDRPCSLRPAGSECMDEVGVSMRMRHLQPDESYLFQKIGFAKDHYEGDETALNWYAKGTPFLMDYGTYTSDVGRSAAHNHVEIPDEDNIRRGYLADSLFTPLVDYTRCEVPVTLKLLWGRVRGFAEVDGLAGTDRIKTPYFYIGDNNPLGPKCWKVRCLLFAKPDYLVLFDRVYGEVPHRYNLHFTGEGLRRNGQVITGQGRYNLDLLAYVQHPRDFTLETGELVPNFHPAGKPDEGQKHRQHFARIYNQQDGIYRTVLFAKEPERQVTVTALGNYGMQIITPEYTDYVFLHNEPVQVQTPEAIFTGTAGWIRRQTDGTVMACVPDGAYISAFGVRLEGRGPWEYNLCGDQRLVVHGATPRQVRILVGE